jgi:membrane-bound lytic murein transglycosylase F
MIKTTAASIKQLFMVTLVTVVLSACAPEPSLLERIQARGELIVATRQSPTTYYKELDRPTGFEYELARRFAGYLGVSLRILTFEDTETLLDAVRQGKADVAATGRVIPNHLTTDLELTLPYQAITPQIIYKSGTARPRTLADLARGTLIAADNPVQFSRIEQINQVLSESGAPPLVWKRIEGASTMERLSLIGRGEFDFTIVDSNEFALFRELHPEVRAAFDLSEAETLSWALARNKDRSLYFAAEFFLNRMQEDGTLEDLLSRFYDHRDFDYVGSRTFMRHLESRLPKYEALFRQVAETYNLDWRLAAAIGYQESLWNPNAISPTGVRGIMMLTQRTAAEMGVTNRRNAAQSIKGGIAYFRKLYDRLPESIQEPHRAWFALASYNAGYGHVMDARLLTQSQGDNPNDWFEVRERLPLLRDPKYYKQTNNGYARGAIQALHYVRNIRKYYESLVWVTEHNSQRYQPNPVDAVAMNKQLVH